MHTVINKKWVSFLITVIFMVTGLSVFSRTYGTSDDIAILWDIQSGQMVSFMSVSMGRFLSFFYRNISDSIPWYGLTLYTFLGISIYCIVLSAWKFEKIGQLLIPFVVVVLTLCLGPMMHISYNSVSILLGSGSMLALLIYLEKSDKKRLLPVILLGICLTFSYHIRMDGIKAVLCFMAPPLLFGIIRARKYWRYLLLFIIPLAITIPADRFYERSLATASDIQFREWLNLLGYFHGFPIQSLNADNEQFRKVNNWSKNDYSILLNWLYLDENKFNISSLKNVFKYAYTPPTVPARLVCAKEHFIALVRTYPIHLCVLMFMALLGLITSRSYGRIMPIIYMAYILTGAIVMQIFFRFPGRIGVPILFGCIGWMAYMVFNTQSFGLNHYDRKLAVFSGFLMMFFACIVLYVFNINMKTSRLKQIEHYKCVQELEAMKGDFFLIHPLDGLHYEFADPLKINRYNFKTVLGGWTIFSPLFYKSLRECGIEHAYAIIPKLVREDKYYVVADQEYMPLLSTYLLETYGLQNRWIPIKELSNHIMVYKIKEL